MTAIIRTIEQLKILSEQLCLDFMNTVSWHLSNEPYDWLTNYEDLITWGQRVNILSVEKAKRLKAEAKAFPDKAAKAFSKAILLRETIFRIFQSQLNQNPFGQEDLDILNHHIRRAYQFLYLKKGEFEFNFFFEDTLEMDCMVWDIVQSTASFLTSSEITKLKQCEGGQCGWLFLDTTKNHSRRWCSMEDCGNRAKAKRHYRKKQKKLD